MSRVYIVNRGGHDFSRAKEYGELRFLTEGKLDRFAINNMYRILSESLGNSNKDDFILMTGLTNLASIACSIFAYKHGRLNLLIYKDMKYIERHIILGELVERDKE